MYAQRCLNAKSFRYYANDAYSPYEVLHVIGLGRDHFLSSKDRKRRREDERGRRVIQRRRIEEEEWGDEEEVDAPRTRGTEESPFGFYRALLQREYIPYFRRGLGEREEDRRRGQSDQRRRKERGTSGNAKGNIRGRRRGARYAGEEKSATFPSPKRIYFSFARWCERWQ